MFKNIINNNNNNNNNTIHDLFTKNEWKLIINNGEKVVYTRDCFECDRFELLERNNRFYVTVPIKNSVYQYKTSFDSYYEASNYVIIHMSKFFV